MSRAVRIGRWLAIKILKSKYDIIVEASCILSLAGVLLYLAITWSSIPQEVPGHYNAMGQIDRITGKASLIAIPIITWVMYMGITAVERFPQIWNTGVAVTEENKDRVYRVLKDILKTSKLIVVLAFSYLTINTANAIPLSPWFTPVFLILIFGSLIIFAIKLVKNK